MKRIFSLVSALALSSITQFASANNELCLASTNNCTFVLLSQNIRPQVSEEYKSVSSQNMAQVSILIEENETLMLVNRERENQHFSPFSTFKIPNSLITLDSKKIKDAQQSLTFDKEKYPVKRW
ncbi:hypothetical protein [Colwellia piezophila]|uniref:hypothetical protein n=1 Tax=Colwellia piezophila TaxID=211668 RepID=UPI000362C467|nr:hypothetical protein [Colwellia piezophila]